jgi:hypothetical protein
MTAPAKRAERKAGQLSAKLERSRGGDPQKLPHDGKSFQGPRASQIGVTQSRLSSGKSSLPFPTQNSSGRSGEAMGKARRGAGGGIRGCSRRF